MGGGVTHSIHKWCQWIGCFSGSKSEDSEGRESRWLERPDTCNYKMDVENQDLRGGKSVMTKI